MQIQQTNNLGFRASLIRSVKLNGNKGKQYNASFIKFNTGSKNDVKALAQVRDLWQGRNMSAGIAEEADILGKDAQIYGLTLQSEGFRNVDSSKILGLVSTDRIAKDNGTEIFKIGTNPKYAYAQKYSRRSIKHIAKTMLENIKKLNGGKALCVSGVNENEMKILDKLGISYSQK